MSPAFKIVVCDNIMQSNHGKIHWPIFPLICWNEANLVSILCRICPMSGGEQKQYIRFWINVKSSGDIRPLFIKIVFITCFADPKNKSILGMEVALKLYNDTHLYFLSDWFYRPQGISFVLPSLTYNLIFPVKARIIHATYTPTKSFQSLRAP